MLSYFLYGINGHIKEKIEVCYSKVAGMVSVNSSDLTVELNRIFKTWGSGIQIHDGQNSI